MKSPVLVLPVLGLAIGLLAGCNTTNQIPNCPSAAILSDTATVTGFHPNAVADPSGEAFTARMETAKTDCSFEKGIGRTTSSLDITIRATRAPSPDPATYTVPYYVVVTQGDRVLSKKIFSLQISFASGSAVTSIDDSVEQTVIQLEKGHPPTDYQLLAGFQLTDAQRAYNSRRRRYTP